MQTTLRSHSNLHYRPRTHGPRLGHRRPGPGDGPTSGPTAPPSNWLTRAPAWVHAVPYASLAVLGGALLLPGVVPNPGCDYESVPGGHHQFIQISAVAFGLVAGLFLLSALTASAQRRMGSPGRPTMVFVGLFGAITAAAMITPHGSPAVPAEMVMIIDFLGVAGTGGAALGVPIIAVLAGLSSLRGSRFLRRTQITAWAVLLTALPLIMAVTYLTVSPICGD